MSLARYLPLLLVLACLAGCSRGERDAEMRGAEPSRPSQGNAVDLGGGALTPSAPASPKPAASTTVAVTLPVLPAAGERGYSDVPAAVYDYELGELDRQVPEAFRLLAASLGGEPASEATVPEWRPHLRRQAAGLPAGEYRLRMGLGRREEGFLVAPVKIIGDNQLILGSIRGSLSPDGVYLVEDLAFNDRLEPPFPEMVMPPPVLTAVGGEAR